MVDSDKGGEVGATQLIANSTPLRRKRPRLALRSRAWAQWSGCMRIENRDHPVEITRLGTSSGLG